MKFTPLVIALALFISGIVYANPPAGITTPPQPETLSSEVTKINDNLYKMGNVKIHKDKRSISIPGSINMADGLVEYLACGLRGKLHESVLALDAEPFHIHAALLLIGLVPGDRPLPFQGSPEPPCGDPLVLRISWKGPDNKLVEYPPEDLIINTDEKKTMEKSDWVFSGSAMNDGRYMAQIDGSVVAVFHDPYAIIDHRSISGADDTHFFANKEILPPYGTPVELKISAEPDPASKKRVSCSSSGR